LIELTVGAGFTHSNGLRHGFLETVYRNALAKGLRLSGLAFEVEKTFSFHD
jgi:hypothetical protein